MVLLALGSQSCAVVCFLAPLDFVSVVMLSTGLQSSYCRASGWANKVGVCLKLSTISGDVSICILVLYLLALVSVCSPTAESIVYSDLG
jgi:hypothetical protein